MPRPRVKKRALSPIFAAICAHITVILMMALVRFPGGSFQVSGIPHIPSASAEIRGGEIPSLPAAIESSEERLLSLYGARLVHGAELNGVYRIKPCSEAETYRALITLEAALELYPQGFFERVPISFLLCGGVRSADPALPDRPAGATLEQGGRQLIILDVSGGLAEHTVFHEFCHAADKLIAASPAGESFNAGWMALQPPGFAYYSSYTDEYGFPLAESGDPAYTFEQGRSSAPVYFLNRYSKTFPGEDRAVLFETLMRSGVNSGLFSDPHIIRKLSYYFAFLRSCFDPEGNWGEVFWEQRLSEILGGIKKAAARRSA